MRRFAELYISLDRSTSTLDKRAALIDYFRSAPPHDAAWALYLLSGGKVTGPGRRIASPAELRAWIGKLSGLPDWLVEASYAAVGDLAETLALLVDEPEEENRNEKTKERPDDMPLAEWVERRLLPLAGQPVEVREDAIINAWETLTSHERLVFNKLLTGALRVGVSQRMTQQALAELSGIDIARIAQRMIGNWEPSGEFFVNLLNPDELPSDRHQPYPFFLASAYQGDIESLGAIDDWLLEWKWDGIRLQLIRRNGKVVLWSRGEERLDGRFPEIELAGARLPDCVLDGELLIWRTGDNTPLPFTALQRRIQRLKPSARLINELPARVIVYDILELDGNDLRDRPLSERRQLLEEVLHASGLVRVIESSPIVSAADWKAAALLRDQSRALGTEGLMVKRLTSQYQVGRRRGDWWKWKIDPLTIDAVLIYAQSGSGRRSTLFTDYTFALWDGEALVPVAKAYSGLTDAEILELDRWIRANTRERFGPVRAVEPVHVFELGFEAVNRSNRHKSGVAVRFPRILRWRKDKVASEADRLDSLTTLAR